MLVLGGERSRAPEVKSNNAQQNLAFFAPALGPNSDLRLARSTFTKPDFKMIVDLQDTNGNG